MRWFCSLLLWLIILPCISYAQKIKLQLSLINGNTYYTSFNQTGTTTQNINKQPLTMEYTVKGNLAFTVQAMQDSVYTLAVRYDSVSLSLTVPTGTFNFSSAKADTTYYAQLLYGFSRQNFKLQLSNTGTVVAASGFSEALIQASNKANLTDTAQKQQAITQLQQLLGDDAFYSNLQNMFNFYPRNTVAAGSIWDVNYKQNTPVPLNINGPYTISNIGAQQCTVNGLLFATADTLNAKKFAINNMPLHYSVTGSLQSTIKVNRKTGWPQSVSQQLLLKGIATIPDNDALPGGIMMPITIDIKNTAISKRER